jgi:N-acetyl sugar amidotransferase
MDTTDPDIIFDENGVCNHCTNAIKLLKLPPYGLPPKEKEVALNQLLENVKTAGKGKQYDCVIGLSGGVDSSYVAYLVKQWGLRPLGIHVDNGWNSVKGTKNIENLCEILDIDIQENVLDWEEFKSLQLAFLKASTPDSEIPTDNIICETLYRTANKYGIKYILSGCNITSESILPKAWSQGHRDKKYITSVYKQFGNKKKLSIPILSIYQSTLYYRFKGVKWVDILDYIQYDKEQAKEYLKQHLGWLDYGRKHGESNYTKIYQEYILPEKFGYDKRRAHYSSQIAAGQLAKHDALEMLKQPLYVNQSDLENDIVYFCNKFGITKEDFEKIMALPIKFIHDYPNENKTLQYKLLNIARSILKLARLVLNFSKKNCIFPLYFLLKNLSVCV